GRRVERGHEGQTLATQALPLLAGANSDLLESLQAVRDEGGAVDGDPADAARRQLGENEVGVGPDPRRPPEARLEAHAPSPVGEAKPGREGTRGGVALGAVAVAVGVDHRVPAGGAGATGS